MKNNHEFSKSIDRLILSLLTMLFVTLKLCGVIDWKWIWIFSPIWIPVLFFGLMAISSILIDRFVDDDEDDGDGPNLDDHIAGP